VPHSKGYEHRREARSGDPVSIGDVVESLMAQEVFSRGMPVAQLSMKWPQVVGERLAAETSPLSLEDGVLVVGVSNGPWGAQAKFLHAEILRHADEALGGGKVRAVKIVVQPR
jgi:predicted nucleic acid-binding Zn ribbon protein